MTEQNPTPSVTVAELDALVEHRFKKKSEVEAKEAEKKQLNKQLAEIEIQISGALEELGRTDYKADAGSVRVQDEWYVSVPKDEESRHKFFNWLKEKKIFDKYITVNGTSLKALFKAERKAASDEGEDMMVWGIPGIDDAKMRKVLRGRKS